MEELLTTVKLPEKSFVDVWQMYRDRFTAFTFLSFFSIFLNLLSLFVILKIKGPKSTYYIFLANLALCDSVGCLLLWYYNNHFVIIPSLKPSLKCWELLDMYKKNASINVTLIGASNQEMQECRNNQVKALVYRVSCSFFIGFICMPTFYGKAILSKSSKFFFAE